RRVDRRCMQPARPGRASRPAARRAVTCRSSCPPWAPSPSAIGDHIRLRSTPPGGHRGSPPHVPDHRRGVAGAQLTRARAYLSTVAVPTSLVIVESPAKARTIARFLGDDFRVEASIGAVRDLEPKGLAVDVDNGFKPTYVVP